MQVQAIMPPLKKISSEVPSLRFLEGANLHFGGCQFTIGPSRITNSPRLF